ncbi:MAG: hypothetical protein HQL01_14015 [Nitrospirae bacterium]|nr:hypothetical protein [Nitrospirota bacterium]
MAIVYDMERDARFRQGRERGMLEGMEKGIERGMEKGMLEGLEKGLLCAIELALDIKFGAEGLVLMDKINKITDVDRLKQIKEHLRKAGTIAEVIDTIEAIK